MVVPLKDWLLRVPCYILMAMDKSPTTKNRIIEVLKGNVDKIYCWKVLERMEKAGLIKRKTQQLYLTVKGKEIRNHLYKIQEARVDMKGVVAL